MVLLETPVFFRSLPLSRLSRWLNPRYPTVKYMKINAKLNGELRDGKSQVSRCRWRWQRGLPEEPMFDPDRRTARSPLRGLHSILAGPGPPHTL